jgi:hypothetical protein
MTPQRIDHRCSARECEQKDSYVMEASCFNCKWEGEIAVTVGHEVSGATSTAACPRCECRRIHNGNFVSREGAWREAAALSRNGERDA